MECFPFKYVTNIVYGYVYKCDALNTMIEITTVRPSAHRWKRQASMKLT